MKKPGVANPYQYDPCIDCGRPARRYPTAKGRCRDCYDLSRIPAHGTEGRYVHHRCHCPACKEAARAARARRRAALGS